MSLTREQVEQLLKPINPSRVLKDNDGRSHVSQQDVRAHLTRVFGFGGWSSEVLSLDVVGEEPTKTRAGKDAWLITYRCVLRLTIRDPQGNYLASFDDVGTGTSPSLPTKGDAHDFAAKVAVSIALKRAAINLGDGYGLSLYNKGQTAALVIATLVMPGQSEPGEIKDVQADVPQQVSLGNEELDPGPDVEAPDPELANDFLASIEQAQSRAELEKIGGDLAKSSVPSKQRAVLRDKYTAKMQELTAA